MVILDWLQQTINTQGSLSDGELVAIIAGSFLVLSTIVTAVAGILTARINRGVQRQKDLEGAVRALVEDNAEQAKTIGLMKAHSKAQDHALKALEDADTQKAERITELSAQLGEFQDYAQKLYAVLDAAPDTATMAEVRPSLPARPDMRGKHPRSAARPAQPREGD